MVDTCVSGAYGAIHAGSSPAFGIFSLSKIGIIPECRTPPRTPDRMVNCHTQFNSVISFQDSCDGSSVVSIPMFRAIEADL